MEMEKKLFCEAEPTFKSLLSESEIKTHVPEV